MLIAPSGCERELEYVAHRIDGGQLTPEHQIESDDLNKPPYLLGPALIERFTPPQGKFIDRDYLGRREGETFRVWHTVTPVILDGYNRKSKTDKPEIIAERTIRLIQAALERAGIEMPCSFTWQSIPFLKNCLSAHKYDHNGRHTGYHRPQHLRTLTAVHVRITFDHPIPGPITIGSGRHCGFGLMAAIDTDDGNLTANKS